MFFLVQPGVQGHPQALGTFLIGYDLVHYFVFPNIIITVLLVDRVISFSPNHASNLLVTPCSALSATDWFLEGIYIARL